eukprot:3764058-Pleurochrysis_carterae.AAC.1
MEAPVRSGERNARNGSKESSRCDLCLTGTNNDGLSPCKLLEFRVHLQSPLAAIGQGADDEACVKLSVC